MSYINIACDLPISTQVPISVPICVRQVHLQHLLILKSFVIQYKQQYTNLVLISFNILIDLVFDQGFCSKNEILSSSWLWHSVAVFGIQLEAVACALVPHLPSYRVAIIAILLHVLAERCRTVWPVWRGMTFPSVVQRSVQMSDQEFAECLCVGNDDTSAIN